MKKTAHSRLVAGVMAIAMTMTLTACRTSGLTTEDASKCVQVEMDATYKGEFKEFMDFYSNVSTEDAKAQYDSKIEYEAGYFMEMYGVPSVEDTSVILEPSEMQAKRSRDLYKDIYAKADYAIASSSKQDDGTFAVKVNVKPVDIIKLVDDNFDAGFEAFWAKFDAVDTDSMSDDDFKDWYTNVFAPEYYDTLLDLLEEQIGNMGYLDEKNIVIQVQQSEEGALFISNEDFSNLDWLIIDYNVG